MFRCVTELDYLRFCTEFVRNSSIKVVTELLKGEPNYLRDFVNLRSRLHACVTEDDSPLTSVEEHNVWVSIDLNLSFGICLFQVMFTIAPITLSRLIGLQRWE